MAVVLELRPELALVDLATGTTDVGAGSSVPPGYAYIAFSPDGEEAFMTGGLDTERVISACRLGEETARTLDVRVGGFYGMVAG